MGSRDRATTTAPIGETFTARSSRPKRMVTTSRLAPGRRFAGLVVLGLLLSTVWALPAGGHNSYSLWPLTDPGAPTADSDRSAVNLGVKFRADREGLITAIRFWRTRSSPSGYTAYLWRSDGALLASGSVTAGQCAVPCWQEVDIPDTAIVDGTVYVASYHSPEGQYPYTTDYFAPSGYSNPPLYALKDGELGGNGVYQYGSTGLFPSRSWQAANYWVDVDFEVESLSSPSPSPEAGSVYPAPSTIDSTCASDVTSALNSWMASVPDGTATSPSLLKFAAGGCYRVEGTLRLVDRSWLVLDGQGATFKATTIGTSARAQWGLIGGSNLVITAMTTQGVNQQAAYEKAYEWQHNWFIGGSQGVTLDGVTARNAYGDGVSVGPDSRPCCGASGAIPARNITVRNSTIAVAGRQGIFCGACDGLVIENNTFDGTGFNSIDLEVEDPLWSGSNVRIANNIVKSVHSHFFANTGPGKSTNVTVVGNTMLRGPETCRSPIFVFGPEPNLRSGYQIEGNRLVALGTAMRFEEASSIAVNDNEISFTPMGCGSLDGVWSLNSSNGAVTGNGFVGAEAVYRNGGGSSSWTVCGNERNGDGIYNEPVSC